MQPESFTWNLLLNSEMFKESFHVWNNGSFVTPLEIYNTYRDTAVYEMHYHNYEEIEKGVDSLEITGHIIWAKDSGYSNGERFKVIYKQDGNSHWYCESRNCDYEHQRIPGNEYKNEDTKKKLLDSFPDYVGGILDILNEEY
jgi:hypothetical protein